MPEQNKIASATTWHAAELVGQLRTISVKSVFIRGFRRLCMVAAQGSPEPHRRIMEDRATFD